MVDLKAADAATIDTKEYDLLRQKRFAPFAAAAYGPLVFMSLGAPSMHGRLP
jgi:hypothetical protein